MRACQRTSSSRGGCVRALCAARKISVCKMSTSNEQLCAGQPDEFVLYLNYTRALQFDSKPDYAYLRGLFRDLLLRKGWQQDSKYDWSSKRTVAAMAGLDVPTVPRPLLSTELSHMPATNSHDTRQHQQRQSHSHSNNQSSPVSAASPQQPLSSSPPLSLSQQRASVYCTDTTHPSPRDSSPRQLSPFYPPQQQPHQQQQRVQQIHQQQQQSPHLLLVTSPHSGNGNHMQNGVDSGRLSQYELGPNSYSNGGMGQSTVYQLSTLPATASPLPVPLLHHVPALNFSHSSSLSSMNPGGGFKSLPAAFPPLLLSPLPAPQPFPGLSSLPFVPSNLSLPPHTPGLHAPFTHSSYQVSSLSPTTFASHPFFSPSVSPSSTTAATLGDGSSRLSSILPHSMSSGSSSQLSIHQHNHHATGHPSLSPSSYSNTHSRSSLSSPLASPHFSSSSASPYLTSASSNLSLSASPLHVSNHGQLGGAPSRSTQPLTPAHFG